jgi:murein DD-endopeptidase MepM/ murein hydrolase activator NlpD
VELALVNGRLNLAFAATRVTLRHLADRSRAQRRLLGFLILAGAAGCGPATEPSPGPTRFEPPIVGVPLQSVFYGAYVDEGGRDYSCGAKFYGGHQGTDILLRSFRTQDSGVTVVAAAAGTVEGTHDGEPDRNASRNGSRPWNFVSILHADGLTSYYGHLRAGSLKVTVGQRVVPGTPLGLVGSSGDSNWPHLHFEVRLGDVVKDPWLGSCQPEPSLWRHQLAYQDRFLVLDTGILDRPPPGQADLLERPADADPVTGSTGEMTFWAELYNVRTPRLRAEFYAPSGTLVAATEGSIFTYSTSYIAASLPLTSSDPAGRYSVVLLASPEAGGDLIEVARRTFTLAPIAAPPSLRTAPSLKPTLRVFSSGGDAPERP